MGNGSYDIEDFYRQMSYYSTNFNAMSGIGNLLRLACFVLSIIGMWNMFIKAGEPGWGALIPYYKTYLLYKIADMKKLFWISLAVSITSFVLMIAFFFKMILSIIDMVGAPEDAFYRVLGSLMGMLVVIGICGIIGLVLRVINAINLAKVFNLNGGYAVGIFFLPFVFYMILGLSKDIYYKNRTPFAQGFAGQNGYNQNPYGQNPYQQNPYGQNPYQQNTYQQNAYQQNPYQQNSYRQNPYGQTTYQQNTYTQDPYASNAAQSSQAYQGEPQNPYANPPKEEAWKTIYDDQNNNLN